MKSNDQQLCGVCGGVAEYLEIDPTLVRLCTALLAIFTAAIPVLLIYIIAAMIMPENEN